MLRNLKDVSVFEKCNYISPWDRAFVGNFASSSVFSDDTVMLSLHCDLYSRFSAVWSSWHSTLDDWSTRHLSEKTDMDLFYCFFFCSFYML